MFSRLKQKLKEETTIPLETANASLIASSTSSSSSSSEHQKLETKKSYDEITTKPSKYPSSSGDETNTSELIDQHTELNKINSTNDLIMKFDTFKEENSSKNNEELDNNSIEKYRQLNVSLLNHIEILNNEIIEKLNENDTIRLELSRINNKLEILEFENENFKEICNKLELELNNVKYDKDELIIKNAELSQKYELLKLVNNKNDNIQSSHTNNCNINNSIESNSHRNNTNEQDYNYYKENFQLQFDENKVLRDDLNEKNKMIKNLQQRLNDMKKTLQKELKYQSLPNENKSSNDQQQQQTVPNNNNNNKVVIVENQNKSISSTLLNNKRLSLTTQSNLNLTNNLNNNNNNLHKKLSANNTNQLSSLHDDVNFKYLKHVIFKFLTSREYEAMHLVKALSVLLNFTNDEEKILKETLEWKMSWFGTRPKIQ